MPTLALRRRDPWWDVEGPAARRRHRYQTFMSFTAFVASMAALLGTGALWAIHLGFAAMLGIEVPFSV
ncbi:MAG TPA: hypothetical protein VFM38_00490 [Candidatus Limnocylindrales bacterium]|nr:hypothetical protein [Candidatus Limnocylindrales bacterium]